MLTFFQVKALLAIYKRLISLGKMDRLRFREILYSMFNITDDIILDRTFGAFDGDNQGSVGALSNSKYLKSFYQISTNTNEYH